jgi:HJR/Mrr/RecB family endonuclease
MEELVGFVFSDFFNCEVQYCGKSHDGGIDLVLVMADKPVLVQVKRRMKPTDVEPVSSVREFLGAALLAGHTDCIFVTSADHFSSVGQAAARKALTRGLVTRYDLIDRRRFLDILDLVRTTKTEVWKEQVQLVLNKHA